MKNQRISVTTGKILAALLTATMVIGGFAMEANAESTGQVTVDNAKVRSDASTDASTVSTLANGTTVTVTDEKSDSSGNVWYHVSLSDGTTGYVRSDLMTVTASVADPAEGTETVSDADASGADAFGMGGMTAGVDVSIITNPDDVTAQDLQNATINVSVGKVRANASTNDDIVAQLSQGTNVVISGSKLGSDSKTWYYVSFLDSGVQKTGYVRSDLVDMGDVIVLAFDQPAEEVDEPVIDEAPVEEVNNDYELVYTDDGTGNNVWWLYNHIDNTREKLQELLDYADSQANKTASLTSANQKLKIVSIVLGVLLALAIIAIIILAIKLGSGGYEYDDDDDDDDDDDEEDEEPVRRRERRPAETRTRDRAPRRRADYDDDDDDDDSDVRTDVAPKKNKPKNFMLDDDDFEFEFLNMDDK